MHHLCQSVPQEPRRRDTPNAVRSIRNEPRNHGAKTRFQLQWRQQVEHGWSKGYRRPEVVQWKHQDVETVPYPSNRGPLRITQMSFQPAPQVRTTANWWNTEMCSLSSSSWRTCSSFSSNSFDCLPIQHAQSPASNCCISIQFNWLSGSKLITNGSWLNQQRDIDLLVHTSWTWLEMAKFQQIFWFAGHVFL